MSSHPPPSGTALLAAVLAAALLLGAAPAPASPAAASAQEGGEGAAAEATESAYLAALRADWERVGGRLVSLAEAIPAEQYDWSPAEGVRSVSGVIGHVVGPNYGLTRSLPGGSEASMPELGESPTKEELVAALEASVEHVGSVFDRVSEDDLAAGYQAFGQEMSGYMMVSIISTHAHEHLGQLIAYARMNGVTPPWSE